MLLLDYKPKERKCHVFRERESCMRKDEDVKFTGLSSLCIVRDGSRKRVCMCVHVYVRTRVCAHTCVCRNQSSPGDLP